MFYCIRRDENIFQSLKDFEGISISEMGKLAMSINGCVH